jgi:phospholipid/cholesterol/gamma-HCH transport system substrate-binding protein
LSEGRASADVRLGAFVLGALAILVLGSLWIAGSTLFVGERVPYVVLLRDSKGVRSGDRVRFAGVPVGRIEDVVLRPEDPWPVRLEVELKPEIPVREDSSATIATSGLMGTSFLQILPGSAESPLLRAGGTIHGDSGGGLEGTLEQVGEIGERVLGILDQTSVMIDDVAAQLGPLMTQLNRLMSEQNVDEIGAILRGVRETIDGVGPRVESLLARLDGIAAGAEQGLADLPRLMERVSSLLSGLDAALGPDGERLAALLDTARGSLDSAGDALGVITDNRAEIEAMLQDLRDTVANLEAASERIKQQPSSLIRSRPEPERRPGDGPPGGAAKERR